MSSHFHMPASSKLLILLILVSGIASAWPGKKDPATLKSLSGKAPEVRIADPDPVSTSKKLNAYKSYLAEGTNDSVLRAESMRRQADLYMEIAEERSVDSGGTLYNDVDQLAAIRIYNDIRVQYPDYDGMEAVLYQLSKAYENVGEQDNVLTTLNEFVRRWPNSQFIAESQFRRGEILFIQKNYAGAEAAYTVVIAQGDSSRFYEQSLYKHGWSCFKQGFYPEGIESFLTLMDRKLGGNSEAETLAVIENLSRADRELFEDTLRVMSIAFSYEDGPDSIRSYVASHNSSGYAYFLYQGLAELYLEKERYIDAASVYEAFAIDYPAHYEAPVFQSLAIAAYRTAGFPSLVLESKMAYVGTYGLAADYWVHWQPEARPEVIAELKVNLSDLAQYQHSRAQQGNDAEAYVAAALWYRTYIDHFPDDPEVVERIFLLGEVLTESAQPKAAIAAYQAAAYDYPGFPKAAEAGFASILAARMYRDTLPVEEQASWDEQQIMDDLYFTNKYPDNPESSALLVAVSEQLFERGRFTAASIVARELLSRKPMASNEFQSVSWRVVALARFDQGSYAYAEQAYLKLASYDISDEERLEVQERIAASIFRQAEAAQLAGDVDLAVADYLRIADSSDIKPVAVFDAATLLIVSERWSESILILQQFRDQYPEHSFSNEVSQKMAYSYLQAGMLLAAAAEFESLSANADLSAETRRESLWQAAELYQNNNQLSAAKRTYRQFVNEFPEPMSESLEARFRLSNIELQLHDGAGRDAVLREIIAEDAAAGSQRSDRSRYLAAKASLELAEPYWERFELVKLNAPLQASMKVKKARMEEALDAYNAAAVYGVAEVTTVATYQVAEIYYQLSKDLMTSEKPPGLNNDELEQYDILLEEQAFPFEEQAIEIYEVNVQRAANGVYDQAVKGSYARLAELMPGRYSRSERTESYASLTD